MDLETQGLADNWLNAPADHLLPWRKPTVNEDPRLHNPLEEKGPENDLILVGAGRRLRHPYLPDIVYPKLPDATIGFGYDVLPRGRAVMIKTLTSSAVAHFLDVAEDVVIKEIWTPGNLSTEVRFFYALHEFRMTPLPIGQFIGWQPRDRTWRKYAVELLSVEAGPTPEEYLIEEQKAKSKPWLMTSQLVLSFRVIRDFQDPAGIVVGEGL